MDAVAKTLTALSSFAWPSLAFILGYYFRCELKEIVGAFKRQLESGAAVKWKDFEFKGISISPLKGTEDSDYEQTPADEILFEKCEIGYKTNKNLFLVHRVRPTSKLHPENNLPLYEISVYLYPHKNYGFLNDVKEVEYYFGKYFGKIRNEFGNKYILKNGNQNFAVLITAYGPTLCEARILFHDGSEATINRYLDFEGTGYVFQALTNDLDRQRRQRELSPGGSNG